MHDYACIFTQTGSDQCPLLQSEGQHKTIVVVSVLTNQIHPPWSEPDSLRW